MELNGSALLEDFDLEFDEPRAEESDDGDDSFDSDVELELGCQWDSGSVDSYYLGSPVGNLSSRTCQRAAVALACSKHVVPTHLGETGAFKCVGTLKRTNAHYLFHWLRRSRGHTSAMPEGCKNNKK